MFSSRTLINRTKNHIQHCFRKMSSNEEAGLLEDARKLIPSLSGTKHKGQDGRVGIFGGSVEYSGAPYFAGMSALRTGADLVHVFCGRDASTPIKSFSPELIVHPILDADRFFEHARPWLPRLHVLLIGPGMGRDPNVFRSMSELIESCRQISKPLVIDADGLFLVCQSPEIIRNYPGTIVLTPNAMEFSRLVETYLHKTVQPSPIASDALIKKLAEAIGPQTIIVAKGAVDKIADGLTDSPIFSCAAEGSGRRCGGQGDLLSGSLSVFIGWSQDSGVPQATKLACYAACRLVRETNKLAFSKKRRGMLAHDMIEEVAVTFAKFFEPDD